MKRNTIILAALVLLLGAAAWLVTMKPGEQSSLVQEGALLVNIDSLGVDKIAIASSTGTVTLEKRGVEWFLTQPIRYKADAISVGQVLHQSIHLNVKSIVSSKPEKRSVFQVDSTGTRVRLWKAGQEQASFVIGKNSQSYEEQYVRLSSSNDVALVNGAFNDTFAKPVKDWRDKKIADVPRDRITEIRYQYGDTTFTLTFKDSVWMAGKDSVQWSALNPLIASLTQVSCDDFIDSALVKPSVMAQISYGGLQLHFVFNKTVNKYFVQSSASPQWFTMESYRANQILRRKKELVKDLKHS